MAESYSVPLDDELADFVVGALLTEDGPLLPQDDFDPVPAFRAPPVDVELFLQASRLASDAPDGPSFLPAVPESQYAGFRDLRRVAQIIDRSDLSGAPLYRPVGVTGGVLPLYDITHAGNLAELRKYSDYSLPDHVSAPPTGETAELIEAALDAHPQIEIVAPKAQALRGVAGLYATHLRSVVQAEKQKPTTTEETRPAASDGGGDEKSTEAKGDHFDLTVIATDPHVRVIYWPWHLVRKDNENPFGITDQKGVATKRGILGGIFGFASTDRDGNQIREEKHGHWCFAYTTPVELLQV